MRTAEIKRKTAETDISLKLNLDGIGKSEIETGCGFLNHMLTLFAKHGRFDLILNCKGDTDVDDHHTVVDTGNRCQHVRQVAVLGQRVGVIDLTLVLIDGEDHRIRQGFLIHGIST